MSLTKMSLWKSKKKSGDVTNPSPNKLKVINNIVEGAYAISEENSDEQGTINKINVLPSQTNLAPITIMVVDTISAVKSRRLLKVLLDLAQPQP